LLRYLEELGLVPQAVVTVLNREPFGGPIWVKVNDRTHALGQEAARHVFVQPITEVTHRPSLRRTRRRKR